jgi:ATP-dependent protease HslVU (ClpYQ) peptidase subunit
VAQAQVNMTKETRERLAKQAVDDTKDAIRDRVYTKVDELLKAADDRYVRVSRPYAVHPCDWGNGDT